jgi:predicted dehydrogenase
MKTVKLGIIGLGYIGQIHLKHSLKLPDVEVAVADISEKALSKSKKMGAKKVFTSYEELLKDKDVEAVIIGLPTHLHHKCSIQAAEAGKHIFLEKPIARTSIEAKEIISAAEKASVKLMMGYPMRFNEELCSVKQKMNDGLIGEVENAHAIFVSSGPFFHRADGHSPVAVPEWWWNKELTGGGVLIDLGSHIINLMRFYFGEITNIHSYLGHRFNLDFEDSAMCVAKFDSGTVAAINVGWFSQSYTMKIDFLGSVKSASVQHSPANPIVTAFQMLTTGKSKFHQPHLNELAYFVDCLRNDVSPNSSGYDGLKDILAIEMAYKNSVKL